MNAFYLSGQDLDRIQAALAERSLQQARPKRPRPRRPKAVRIVLQILKYLGLAHACWLGWVLFMCLLYLWVNPGITGFMIYRSIETWGQAKPVQIRPIKPVSFKDIPKRVRRAFITLEDHSFYQHNGISPGAIREAMERNARYKKLVFGGSTISQQTAKNLFLYPDRTLVRKYLEILATLVMESVLSKDRILELYLNTIEFGPGVFGLGAAARYHYGTSFQKLGTDQALRLAVIITSPLRFTPKTFYKNPGMAARYRALQ